MGEKFITTKNREVFLKVIPKSDVETIKKVISFLKEDFQKNEPINKCLKLAESPNLPLLDQLYEHAIASNTTIVAFDSKGAIVGVSLNCVVDKDVRDEFSPDLEPDEAYGKYLELLGNLDGEANVFEKLQVTKGMEQMVLSVCPAWQGEGVAKIIIDFAKKQAKELNCGLVMAFSTNSYASKAFKSSGFQEILKRGLWDFKNQSGERIFPTEEPHEFLIFQVCKID